MSLKHLFKDNKSLDKKINTSVVEKEIESLDEVDSYTENQLRWKPIVDFTRPENFSYYGLAQEYYEHSIETIATSFPYDGSKTELEDWYVARTNLDLHLLENGYPREVGHIKFSANGYGAQFGFPVDSFARPTNSEDFEYISFNGGPNRSSTLNGSNIQSGNLESNLAFDLSGDGNTVEFWLKKSEVLTASYIAPPAFVVSTEIRKETIFDLWNNQPTGSTNYCRFLLNIQPDSADSKKFNFLIQSGTVSHELNIGSIDNFVSDSWRHYAFSISSASVKCYVNGELNETVSLTGSFNKFGGPLTGFIGSIQSQIKGKDSSIGLGHGKLSASLDDFRFWKEARTGEEIKKNYHRNIFGGTNNTDSENKLGLYFKFNEGITGNSTIDSSVLDYSGRISNGIWTGYTSNSRLTSSAIDDSESGTEFKDPIIRTSNPRYSTYYALMSERGKIWDQKNANALYYSIPEWILQEDREQGGELRKLTQMMASYLDTLYLQIKGVKSLNIPSYSSGSYQASPLSKLSLEGKGLIVPDLFVNSSVLNEIREQSLESQFAGSILALKNKIYENLNNNIIKIFKSKGTKKAFQNLLVNFGIDENLVEFNTYADNADIKIGNLEERNRKNKLIDFNNSVDYSGVIFTSQTITSSLVDENLGINFNANVVFPQRDPEKYQVSINQDFLTSSIAGFTGADNSTTFISSVRDDLASPHSKFLLSSSYFGVLTSSIFEDVYDNQMWNIGFSLGPRTAPNNIAGTGSFVSGSWKVRFYGNQAVEDRVERSFALTSYFNPTGSLIQQALTPFAGAVRTAFTGTVQYQSDIKLSSYRAFQKFLSPEEEKQHAIDFENYGTIGNYGLEHFITELTGASEILPYDTLIFNWEFDQVTGSSAFGGFTVQDSSSGSFGFSTAIPSIDTNYLGIATGFLNSSTAVVETDFVNVFQNSIPGTFDVEGVELKNVDTEIFTRDTELVQFIHTTEKSPMAQLSKEILKGFAFSKDFNNFIGEYVHRFRNDYKNLRQLRERFFSRVQNDINLNKYFEFYKWIDSSINTLVEQLIPAATLYNEKVLDVIESHILERNKIDTKFPTLEFDVQDPESGIKGINELTYNWRFGHSPISGLESDNCLWWKQRAERSASRELLFSASLSAFNRKETTPYKLIVDNLDVTEQKKTFYYRAALQEFGPLDTYSGPNLTASQDYLLVRQADIEEFEDCNDQSLRSILEKKKIPVKVINGKEWDYSYSYGYANKRLPFTLYSSSLNSGYQSDLSASFKPSVAINDHHKDIGDNNIQSPFTRRWAGGLQHRKVEVNRGGDTQVTRPEGYFILYGNFLNTGEIGVVDATYTSTGVHDKGTPRANLNEGPKRPVNIANIQTTTASFSLGNYQKTYEIVSTSGRKINDLWFRDNKENIIESKEIAHLNTDVTDGSYNYTLPVRGTNDAVIISRFSSPGDFATLSRGYLDRESEELSQNNELPFRNWQLLKKKNGGQDNSVSLGNSNRVVPRLVSTIAPTGSDYAFSLDLLSSRRSDKSGYDVSGSIDGDQIASFHKTNRNPLEVRTDKIQYDNLFVQHQIPRSELGYRWVTASVSPQNTFKGILPFRGYLRPSGSTSEEIEGPQFVSASFDELFSTATSSFSFNNAILIGATSFDTIEPISFAGQGRHYYFNRLNRGAHGWFTAKQIDAANNLAVIKQRQTNKLVHKDSDRTFLNSNIEGQNNAYVETPVVSKFKPILHTYENEFGRDQEVKYSHGNLRFYFSNPSLNQKLRINDQRRKTNYHVISSLYLNSERSNEDISFKKLKYKETIYPKVVNTYRQKSRYRREVFDTNKPDSVPEGSFYIDYEINNWWAPSRADRSRPDYNTNYLVLGRSTSGSVWPMDAPTPFIDGPYALSQSDGDTYGTSFSFPGTNGQSTSGILSDEGSFAFRVFKLQFGNWENEYTYDMRFAPLYARPVVSSSAVFVGSSTWEINSKVLTTKWTAAEEAGKNPFYFDNYAKYAEITRLVGKDFTIIPEYIISKFNIAEIEENTIGQQLNNSEFSIKGFNISSSLNAEFVKDYSQSDFLKYFNLIQYEHQTGLGKTETSICIECEGIVKLFPYEGFYPQHYTAQLADEFLNSYGRSTRASAASVTGDRGFNTPVPSAYANWPSSGQFGTNENYNVIMEPFFRPGVLFNSIKSGVAVDWPTFETTTFESYNNGDGVSVTSASLNPSGSTIFKNSTSDANSVFTRRIPFESIVNPGLYVSGTWASNESTFATANYVTASFVRQVPDSKFHRKIDNFLASSLDFFIEDGTTTKIVSKFLKQVSVVPGKKYVGTIKMAKQGITQYSRPGAFGMAVSSSNGVRGFSRDDSFHPYTPSYMTTNGVLEDVEGLNLEFNPTKSIYTVKELVSELTASYTFDSISTASDASFNNRMKLTASLDYDKFIVQNPDTDSESVAWVIQVKWEAPILDFSHRTATEPTGGYIETEDFSVGMWHQYGRLPSLESEGVSLYMLDDISGSSTLTGSLRDLLGIPSNSQKVGDVRNIKEVGEAMVAVPYIPQSEGIQQFFEIDRDIISRVERELNGESVNTGDIGQSIKDMVSKMKRYQFPPRFDFLNRQEVRPFGMYIFEFNHAFSKQDLADIWQGLPPTNPPDGYKNITVDFDFQKKKVVHKLNSEKVEILNRIPENLRWFIFKVKYRGPKFYFEQRGKWRKFNTEVEESQERLYAPNWPYDFFSMVELSKVNVEIEIGDDEPSSSKTSVLKPLSFPTLPANLRLGEDE